MKLLNGDGVEKDEKAAFLQFQLAANDGHAAATFQYANCLEHGIGVDANLKSARKFYRRAAESGDASSMVRLGLLSRSDADKAPSFRWFQRAAEKGNRDAFVLLADCFQKGLGVKANAVTAVSWLQRAVDADHADAIGLLGECYLDGSGVDRDVATAIKLFRRAADAGCAESMVHLAMCFQNGIGVQKNVEEAQEWSRRAAEAGKPDAGKDNDVKWLRRAANTGDVDSMVKLGQAYQNGTGDLKMNEKTALEWFQRAAQGGSEVAVRIVGDMLTQQEIREENHRRDERNEGVMLFNRALDADTPRESFDLFRRAAAVGHARSMSEIGICYLRGTGVRENAATAAHWFQRAADHGDHEGMFNLALGYQKGLGVPYDLDKAMYWFDRAGMAGARGGKERAQSIRDHGEAGGAFSLMQMVGGALTDIDGDGYRFGDDRDDDDDDGF
jgi:TPR repeat protein